MRKRGKFVRSMKYLVVRNRKEMHNLAMFCNFWQYGKIGYFWSLYLLHYFDNVDYVFIIGNQSGIFNFISIQDTYWFHACILIICTIYQIQCDAQDFTKVSSWVIEHLKIPTLIIRILLTLNFDMKIFLQIRKR